MNLLELEQLKQKALSTRQLSQDSSKARVTVGMGTCGIKAGAGDVLDSVRQELHNLGSDVVVTPVGCLGMCSVEPILEVRLPGKPVVTYGKVDRDKVSRIINEHLMKNQPVKEWAVALRD